MQANQWIEKANKEKSMPRVRAYCTFVIALLALIVVAAATPAYAQTFSALYDFGTQTFNALNPEGAVAQGRDGALYSTSPSGGGNNWGSVFKVTPAGKEMVVYSFCSATKCADGSTPVGGLTLRLNGHFIGTTTSTGPELGLGTIFDVSQTGTLTTLYTFTGGADGATPLAPPILGPDGSFYGTAQSGGKVLCGTIYRLTGSAFEVVHNFSKVNGCSPAAALVLGTDGNLYGTTAAGGTGGGGVVFQLQLPMSKAPVFTVLTNFSSSNGQPLSALVEGSDGNFYGTTSAAPGSVFSVTPTGTLTIVHALNGSTDGSNPYTGLALATDGNFYGTAYNGGGFDGGTLFQVTPTGDFSVLYNFGAEGEGFYQINDNPEATPFQNTNGLLYGDTFYGGGGGGCNGESGCGMFYSWADSLPASVSTVPFFGKVGSTVEILGQGFTSATTVSFNGTPATATVVSGDYLSATVPAGATTGFVTVTTSSGTLTSNRQFVVAP